jgi:hypothetical protein
MDNIVRKTNENALVTETNSGESVAFFGDWRDEVLLDSVAMTLAESRMDLRKEYRDELTAAIHKLELQMAELRGELKGIREDRRADNVVELPR